MNKTNRVVLLVCVLFGIFCFPGLPCVLAQSPAQSFEIGSIEIAGNRVITRTDIMSNIRSRVGLMFDPTTAAEDAKQIAEIDGVEYSYYNTEVVADKIKLTFVVVERNLVRTITFSGSRKIKAKTLSKKLDFKIGDYLDPVSAEAGRKAVEDYYYKKGFAFAEVRLQTEKLSIGEVNYLLEEGSRVKIKKVKFRGNKTLKTKNLRKALKTKTKKFVILQKYFNRQQLSDDVTRLQSIYYQRGFLNVDIEPQLDFNENKSNVKVSFVINEGPAYRVEKTFLSGVKHFKEDQLHSGLRTQAGGIYNERKAQSDVNHLLKCYREIGFVDVTVEYTRQFISKNSVNVEFAVNEGQRFRLGQINISGNEETQDKVIRHVLDEYDFVPGKWFNADIARGDGNGYLEKLIRQTAYTETASIVPTGQIPGQRDALIDITEGQTGMVMVGAGVSSDSGAIGQFMFEQRNFDIADKPESFGEFITGRAFKGGGQNLRISLSPGTELSQYYISFTEPYLYDRPLSLDVAASSYERERESYDEERLRGHLGLEKRYKNKLRRSFAVRLEDVDVTGIDFDAPKEIKDDKGGNTILGVKLGIGKDLRDDQFNPTSGTHTNASYEQVGGDHTFGILSGTYRRYKTIYTDLADRKTVLATKLLGATIVGDAPAFEKFYGGGSGTYGIRGFDYRGVSTRGKPTNSASTEKKDPIGSNWIFLANAEVTVPLVSDNFAALFFVDSGTIDSGNYRASIGIGIQILLPQWFGPVPMRFELAAPFLKGDGDETRAFSFSMGRLF